MHASHGLGRGHAGGAGRPEGHREDRREGHHSRDPPRGRLGNLQEGKRGR